MWLLFGDIGEIQYYIKSYNNSLDPARVFVNSPIELSTLANSSHSAGGGSEEEKQTLPLPAPRTRARDLQFARSALA